MFRVTVNLRNAVGGADRFERAYERGVQQMKERLDEAADEERRTHAYQNRTGDLEASTYASDIISIGDADEVQFGAREPYAEYVNARGLMQIDELAAEAAEDIGYLFEGLASAV